MGPFPIGRLVCMEGTKSQGIVPQNQGWPTGQKLSPRVNSSRDLLQELVNGDKCVSMLMVFSACPPLNTWHLMQKNKPYAQ